ncbi:hypothetical protein [Mangrovibacter phragmitis]|uniref:hypothetical protein n=1 Tax=Mangrovibacter phragmitis TaxID=1691903 RepID=UPI003369F81E
MAIVSINISVTNPPKPSALLKSGALVSQGGTNLTAGTYQLLTTATDINAILASELIQSITWEASTSGNNVSLIELQAAHGWGIGDNVKVTISGVTPGAYNGTFTATVISTTAFTIPMATNPGSATVLGTVSPYAAAELTQMNTSFWAQGKTRSVYVLELGEHASDSASVATLAAFIAEDVSMGNTYQKFFSYLTPRSWDTEATFKTLCGLYTNPNNLVKFFVTTTLLTYSAWVTKAFPNVMALVESPDIPATEFSMAAPFQSSLSNDPGSSNKVPPMSYRFMYGTTSYPVDGNSEILTALESANISYIGTAAEGGLSNMMLVKGNMLDGNPFNYWYSVAWAAINLELDLANEIINGSNTTINPLYYDQVGIDRLQKRALKTMRNGITYGLILGQVVGTKLTTDDFNTNFNNGDYAGNAVINAVPFADYTAANESDYQAGKYGGLSAVMTPKRGFDSITFNVNVTNFVG